jgi:hypothetical protein
MQFPKGRNVVMRILENLAGGVAEQTIIGLRRLARGRALEASQADTKVNALVACRTTVTSARPSERGTSRILPSTLVPNDGYLFCTRNAFAFPV